MPSKKPSSRHRASYAAKFDLHRTDEWFMLKLQEEVGELTQAFVDL